ncbi:MAG TPA: DUF2277 domain-containing protein [Dehalococcoidia bacterium]|nr:DUF2277 domain-containing protein [Dehalococcoidia bacterium]
MCRSIKTLRRAEGLAPEQEINEAALQFVRKVSGYRVPSLANQAVFDQAVREISAASRRLLDSLKVRGPA